MLGPMSEDYFREHLKQVREYVESELQWGREAVQSGHLSQEQFDDFHRLTVEHYHHEVKRLLGEQQENYR